MQKKEAKLTTELIKYLRSDQCPLECCAIEVKIFKDNKFYKRELKEHQLTNLLNVANKKFVYKIPDLGYQNPFDVVVLGGAPAFLVIISPVDKFAYFIDINDYIKHQGFKITVDECKKMAIFSLKLK